MLYLRQLEYLSLFSFTNGWPPPALGHQAVYPWDFKSRLLHTRNLMLKTKMARTGGVLVIECSLTNGQTDLLMHRPTFGLITSGRQSARDPIRGSEIVRQPGTRVNEVITWISS